MMCFWEPTWKKENLEEWRLSVSERKSRPCVNFPVWVSWEGTLNKSDVCWGNRNKNTKKNWPLSVLWDEQTNVSFIMLNLKNIQKPFAKIIFIFIILMTNSRLQPEEIPARADHRARLFYLVVNAIKSFAKSQPPWTPAELPIPSRQEQQRKKKSIENTLVSQLQQQHNDWNIK